MFHNIGFIIDTKTLLLWRLGLELHFIYTKKLFCLLLLKKFILLFTQVQSYCFHDQLCEDSLKNVNKN